MGISPPRLILGFLGLASAGGSLLGWADLERAGGSPPVPSSMLFGFVRAGGSPSSMLLGLVRAGGSPSSMLFGLLDRERPGGSSLPAAAMGPIGMLPLDAAA